MEQRDYLPYCFSTIDALPDRSRALKAVIVVQESVLKARTKRTPATQEEPTLSDRKLPYTACERRELHHVRVGGRRAIRLKPEWIDAWLEQHARGAQGYLTAPHGSMQGVS